MQWETVVRAKVATANSQKIPAVVRPAYAECATASASLITLTVACIAIPIGR
jgi:hypothetical protein